VDIAWVRYRLSKLASGSFVVFNGENGERWYINGMYPAGKES
jgi:hypothetical protein